MKLAFRKPKLFFWFFGNYADVPGSNVGWTGNEKFWLDERCIPIVHCICTYPLSFGPPGQGTTYPTPTGSAEQKAAMVMVNWAEHTIDWAASKGRTLKEIGVFFHTFGNWNRGDITQNNVEGIPVLYRNPGDKLSAIPGGANPDPAEYMVPWVETGLAATQSSYGLTLLYFKQEMESRGLGHIIVHFIDDFEDSYNTDGHVPTPPIDQKNWAVLVADPRYTNDLVYEGTTFSSVISAFTGGGGVIDQTQYIFQTSNLGFASVLTTVILKNFAFVTYQAFNVPTKTHYPHACYNLYGIYCFRPNPICPPGLATYTVAREVNIPPQESQSIYVYNWGDNGAGNNAVGQFMSIYDIPGTASNSTKAEAIHFTLHKHLILDAHIIAPDKPLTIWFANCLSEYTITSMSLPNFVPSDKYWVDLVTLNLNNGGLWNINFNPHQFAGQPDKLQRFITQTEQILRAMDRVDPTKKPFIANRRVI